MAALPVWAQQGSAPSKSPANPSSPASGSAPAGRPAPNLTPPRSDSVNADTLGDESGQSSSKDSQIDLSPPADDVKAHPQSSDLLLEAGTSSDSNADLGEFHPWDPHKAAKDVEVGDFYFKRKNYRAAEDRYREALLYTNNDAIATFRLAECLEKLDLPGDARKEYESYLKILPHGPQAEEAQKAIERMKGTAASAKTAK